MFSDSRLYKEDIEYIADFKIDWHRIKNSSILITGATGLIGTVIVDALMHKNSVDFEFNSKVLVLSRNENSLKERFEKYYTKNSFRAIQGDVTKELIINEKIDYIINLASNTHPVLYASEPIGTIDAIVAGTKNILDLASKCQAKRVINVSSVEVYGENRGDVERFTESYCGYINCNTLRAGYPEGKRLSEAICQAYIAEKKIDVVSDRLGRVYGPTLLSSDTKSTTQFIRSSVKGDDIVLRSEGRQEYSYVYVADVVTALLIQLTRGDSGEAYNIAHDEIRSLRGLAEILAKMNKKRVVFNAPGEIESKGFSVVQRALMDSSKMQSLGWEAKYNLQDGLDRTVQIIRGVDAEKS